MRWRTALKWWIRVLWMMVGVVIGMILSAPYINELAEVSMRYNLVADSCLDQLEYFSDLLAEPEPYNEPIDDDGEEIWY